MLRVLSPLLILGLLQSCSDSNLQGGIQSNSLRTKTTTGDKGLPASSDGQGSTDNSPVSSENPKSDSGPTSGETILTDSPAIPPSIVAGASLTCIESSPKIELRCVIKINNVLSDRPPLGIFIIQGTQSTWSPLAFTKASLGTYLAKLSSPSDSYGVAMKFDKSEYALTTVGAAALEFADVIKDGSFEALPIQSLPTQGGYSSSSFSTPEELVAIQSPWELKKSSYKGCDTASPLVQVFNFPTNQQAYEGNKWIGLDTNCDGELANANITISQKFQAKLGHFYQVSHARKVSSTIPTLTAEIDFYWNGDRYPIDTTSNSWVQDVRYFISEKDNVNNRISFHETGSSDGSGTEIDAVKVIDFGAPI